MPVISRFLGIVIAMLWNDHAPPHFHARYGEFESRSKSKPVLSKASFHHARSAMCSNGANCTRMN